MTVKRLISGLAAILLVLVGAGGFIAIRYSPDQIARWFLPADVTLNGLSGLSFGWSGGGIEQLDITLPQGQVLAQEARWMWQPKLSTTLPLRLVSMSAREIMWVASSQPDDPLASPTAAPLQLQIDDFRKSAWWPAVETAEIEVNRLSLAFGEERAEVTMNAPIAFQQGAVAAELGGQRIDVSWSLQAPHEWQISASLLGARHLISDWLVQAQDDHISLDGELNSPDLPLSQTHIVLTLNPFAAVNLLPLC